MEGVIQYRILGSHPAASGRYFTMGFPGDAISIQQVMQEVVKEHQINLSAFKAVITRAPLASATGMGAAVGMAGSNTGGDATATDADRPVTLHLTDTLQNYDRIAITVSKRSLADEVAEEEERQRVLAQSRLREMEEQLDGSDRQRGAGLGGELGSGRASRARGGARGQRGLGISAADAAGGGGGGSAGSPTSPTAVDALALKRAMVLASRDFPVRPGARAAFYRPGDPANDHVCVLCELAAFRELLAPCCHMPVCTTCLQSAQAMMASEEECPVCGRNRADNDLTGGGVQAATAAPRSAAPARASHAPKKEEAVRDEMAAKGSFARGLPSNSSRAGTALTAGRKRAASPTTPPTADAGTGGARLRHTPSSLGSSSAAAAATRSPGWSVRGGTVEGGDRSRAVGTGGALSPSVLRVERELLSSLDRTLSFLDAPDPLSEEAKALRVKSAALTALDELGE